MLAGLLSAVAGGRADSDCVTFSDVRESPLLNSKSCFDKSKNKLKKIRHKKTPHKYQWEKAQTDTAEHWVLSLWLSVFVTSRLCKDQSSEAQIKPWGRSGQIQRDQTLMERHQRKLRFPQDPEKRKKRVFKLLWKEVLMVPLDVCFYIKKNLTRVGSREARTSEDTFKLFLCLSNWRPTVRKRLRPVDGWLKKVVGGNGLNIYKEVS